MSSQWMPKSAAELQLLDQFFLPANHVEAQLAEAQRRVGVGARRGEALEPARALRGRCTADVQKRRAQVSLVADSLARSTLLVARGASEVKGAGPSAWVSADSAKANVRKGLVYGRGRSCCQPCA